MPSEGRRRWVIRQGRAYYLASFALSIALAAVVLAAAPLFWAQAGALLAARGGVGLLSLAVAWAAAVVLHELAHGVAARRLGCDVRVQYGVRRWHGLPIAFYTSMTEGLLSRRAILGVLAAPQVLLVIALGMALAAAPGSWPLLATVALAMVAGSSGDFVVALAVLRSDATYVRDTPDGIELVA